VVMGDGSSCQTRGARNLMRLQSQISDNSSQPDSERKDWNSFVSAGLDEEEDDCESAQLACVHSGACLIPFLATCFCVHLGDALWLVGVRVPLDSQVRWLSSRHQRLPPLQEEGVRLDQGCRQGLRRCNSAGLRLHGRSDLRRLFHFSTKVSRLYAHPVPDLQWWYHPVLDGGCAGPASHPYLACRPASHACHACRPPREHRRICCLAAMRMPQEEEAEAGLPAMPLAQAVPRLEHAFAPGPLSPPQREF